MKYLICESCGGYYALLDGESPGDFDFCQCGGELHLVEDELPIQSSLITCKNCGNPNTENTAFCSECGQILMPAKELSAVNQSEKFKPLGIFAGVTFILVSILILGLFV
jgi:ribosomal protein L32